MEEPKSATLGRTQTSPSCEDRREDAQAIVQHSEFCLLLRSFPSGSKTMSAASSLSPNHSSIFISDTSEVYFLRFQADG